MVLIVTILGGLVAGFLGTTLAAPATSIGIQVFTRLREAGVFADASKSETTAPRAAAPPG